MRARWCGKRWLKTCPDYDKCPDLIVIMHLFQITILFCERNLLRGRIGINIA